MENRKHGWVALALLVLVALALYVRTLGYEYVWDALLFLDGYHGRDGAVRALTQPFFFTGYYRPLASLSFVSFDEAAAQHAVNVLLHAVNTVLVLYVARALMPAEVAGSRAGLLAAALGALVFAVHPVGVEAVAWVSGRFDTLMCTFALGTCVAALAISWPTLHFIGIPNTESTIISDRYALAPMALLLASLAALAGAWLVQQLPAMNAGERRVLVYTGVLGLLWTGALVAHSHVTIPLWRNENVFWQFAHVRVPKSRMAHENYIFALMRKKRWQEADAEFQKFWHQHSDSRKSIRIDQILEWMQVRAYAGDYAGTMDLFVWVERRLAEHAQSGVNVDNDFADLYLNRGLIEAGVKNWEQAAYYLEKSLEIVPHGVRGRRSAFHYAEALFMTGHAEKSEQVLNRALAEAPAEEAASVLEWRKTWRLPAAAAEGAGQGASAPASAPAP